jgi:hypothetical protein
VSWYIPQITEKGMIDMQNWYFVCFVNDRVIHAQHFHTGYENAQQIASNMYNFGIIIEGETVEFTRVVAISEQHEIAFDVRGQID